ncbi:MAG: glycosyltransferase family 2 protein [Candidatus Enteromonas sp.]|nr:glycosyltransferase family 2 protein [Candidatus Enteromonas sp.]
MDKIAVLIPCYNEEITIAKVIADAKSVLPEATIYVYDNNSIDATAKIAEEAGAIVRKEPRQGKGNVIRTMFRDIDAEVYLMVDGDDTYGLETAPEMVRRVLEDNVDMVIGDRLSGAYYSENKRPFHNFGNDLVRFQINHLFHANVKDVMTGYRAFSYRFVKTFAVRSKGFEIETEMTAHAADKNMLMSSLPITYRDRPEGSYSKLHTFRDGMKVLGTIGMLFRKFRPMAFYGILAAILGALGIGFLIPVIYEFVQTSQVERFPTLIVCCFTILAAMLCLLMGFLFSTLRAQSQTEFEHSLIAAQDAFVAKKNQK